MYCIFATLSAATLAMVNPNLQDGLVNLYKLFITAFLSTMDNTCFILLSSDKSNIGQNNDYCAPYVLGNNALCNFRVSFV